jgi:transposase
MSKAQLVITAVVLEGRSKSEVARDYDLSRQWVPQLVNRYQIDGAAAFEPRSRRPHHSPQAISVEVAEQIVRLRKTLTKRGLDAGADTIAAHLANDPSITNVPAISTIWRILKRRGFVTPQPHKRPRSAWKRFCAGPSIAAPPAQPPAPEATGARRRSTGSTMTAHAFAVAMGAPRSERTGGPAL